MNTKIRTASTLGLGLILFALGDPLRAQTTSYATAIPGGITAVATDASSGDVIGIANSGSNPVNTYRWNGSSWTSVPSVGPLSRTDAAFAGEPNGGVVLFGGSPIGAGTLPNNTWVLRGAVWSTVTTATTPSQRTGAAAAQLSQTGETVLFGGLGANGLLNETWLFDGTDWTQVPGPGPSARFLAAMAPDGNGNVLLFGGLDVNQNFTGDTWRFSGTDRSWTMLTQSPLQPTPPGRILHGMALIPEPALLTSADRSEILLVGGSGPSVSPTDIWTFRYNFWQKLPAGVTSNITSGSVVGAGNFARREAIFVDSQGSTAFVAGRYGFTTYGSSCTCGSTVPLLGASNIPTIGKLVKFGVTNGVPNSFAFLASDFAAPSPTAPPIGAPFLVACRWWINAATNSVPFALDASGVGTVGFTIPNSTGLIGTALYYQAVDFNYLCVTNGLEMRVGR